MAKKSVLIFDSGSLVTAAAIDSGVIDTSGFESVSVVVQTTDVTARVVAYIPLLADGTTQIVAGGISMGNATGPATFLQTQMAQGNGTAASTMVLGPKSRWNVAAGASGTMRLIIWGR
jgi:hypothetical protein